VTSRVLNVPLALPEHQELVSKMSTKASSGWFDGTAATLAAFAAVKDLPSRTNPDEVWVRLLLSRDRSHHSSGWWRNAEYEYCWHLSVSARDATDVRLAQAGLKISEEVGYVDLPRTEEMYWGRLFFDVHADKVWHEPGGTDPSLTLAGAHRNNAIVHLRLFLDPETFQPFIPNGEVYDLTRWLPGLTPEKVDR
jgi:hypothetical protein